MARAAKPDDVDAICASLPSTRLGTSWGDMPTWLVPDEGKGRGFVMYRRPHKTAIDPETGELYDDLIIFRTADAADKEALVESGGPFFTIPHFNGYNAVLAQQSRIGEISREELVEVITDAWLAVAPKRLAKQHLDSSGA